MSIKRFRNNETGEVNIQTQARLVNMGDKEMKNVNGTRFVVSTVDLTLEDGSEKRVNAICYAGNYELEDANFEEGKSYLATVSPGDDRGQIVQLSHLPAGGRLDDNDFSFELDEEEVEEPQA